MEETTIMTLRRIARQLTATIVLGALLGGSVPMATAADDNSQLAQKAGAAIDRALRWMRTVQKPDGGYGGHLGVTAMVVWAMARSPRQYREIDGPFMRDAVALIRKSIRSDGSIAQPGGYEMYTTALSVLALKAVNDPKDEPIIAKARDWMKTQQTVEALGYRPEERFYGGFGYGSSLRPDLSNTQYAIEALRVAGVPANDVVLANAVKFIQRIQNRTESNDVPGALDDGGFAYYPGFSFAPAGGWTSVGSMTYAGIKSYLYADMDKTDPRVQAALKWISNNYTVDEHPGMGAMGYYYYIDIFAKTWNILKQETVTTADGVKHDWFQDVVSKLLAEQRPEGFWVNGRNGRFWEDRPELATAHAVLALIYALESRAGKK
jgi:squalene-hopene/tetraprenyl-beta-curcumene cyclase